MAEITPATKARPLTTNEFSCLQKRVKFLSLEPLLGPLNDLNLTNIDWVIVGGESGPKARPLKHEWVVDIRDQCLRGNVAFFFKQWGGAQKKKNGRILDGQTWSQLPVIAPA